MNVSNLMQMDMSPVQILLGYLLAFALAFLWATVYRKTHSGIAYTRSFYHSLLLIPPTVAMIMMAIGSNIALSLGLVGALSIIRFRTVIKDTKDMTFLFMAIAIGLTAGANAWVIGVIGTIVVSGITFGVAKIGRDSVSSSDYVLIFRSDKEEPWESAKPEVQDLISWRQLRGATEIDGGKEREYTYNVRLRPKTSAEQVVGKLTNGAANGAFRNVTMIAPENHLDL